MKRYLFLVCMLLTVFSCTKRNNATSTTPVVKPIVPVDTSVTVKVLIDTFKGSYIYNYSNFYYPIPKDTLVSDTSIITLFYVTHISADTINISSYIPEYDISSHFYNSSYNLQINTSNSYSYVGRHFNAKFIFPEKDSLIVLFNSSAGYSGGDGLEKWTGIFKGVKI